MKKYFILLLGILFIPAIAHADNEIILSSNSKNIKQGDTISVNVTVKSDNPIGSYEYTLDYNDTNLSTNENVYVFEHANDKTTKQVTKNFKFKVLKSGTYKITVKAYDIRNIKDEVLDVGVKPLTITTNKEGDNSNYLSSLEVVGYKISPSFNKSTNKYTLDINKTIEKVQIKASSSGNSTIIGTGNVYLNPGQNKANVKVIDSNGNENIYTIIINVKDENPITTVIDNKTYTIIKDNSTLDVPSGYESKKITIDGEEVIALYNEDNGFTLVGLEDEDGNIEFYIYDEDDNSFTLYKEIVINGFRFVPVGGMNKEGYSKYKITIKDTEIECFKLKEDSDYALIYGLNLKTNETTWYSYNENEESIQKYNTEIDDYYNEKLKNTEILIYILLASSLLFGLLVIVLAIKNSNKKRLNFKN